MHILTIPIMIASTNKTLAAQKISVVVTDEAKQILIEKGYDPKMGAHPMRRIVQKTIENFVAAAIYLEPLLPVPLSPLHHHLLMFLNS